MHTSISHLTGKEQNDLHHITKRIVENIGPERIFLFGSRLCHEIHRSFFIDKRRTETHTSMYDLVIIINDEEKLEEDAIRLFAENIVRHYAKANIMVHRRNFLINKIVEGNYFFSWLHRFAILLYSKDKLLHLPPQKANSKGRLALYTETLPRVKQFQTNAKSYLSTAREQQKEKANATALYMARQSIENSCGSLIYGCSGYLPSSGNLTRLFNYTRNFTAEAIAIFPENTKEEKRLFQLLSEASGTAHTNELRNATSVELIILIDRADQLYQLAERFIHKRIATLKTNNISLSEDTIPKNTEHANHHNPGTSQALS